MSSLLRLVSASQIVFGTDFPFVSAAATAKGLEGFADSDLTIIGRTNAAALLPRVGAG